MQQLDPGELEGTAFYYPSRMTVMSVRVLGKKTRASHDHGAHNFERRHFIDKDFLLALPGGQALLDTVVEPVPLCAVLNGTKTPGGELVVGMLSEPLAVMLRQEETSGDKLAPAVSKPVAEAVEAVPIVEENNLPEAFALPMDAKGAASANYRVRLVLGQVLVVESLPLPLHVSATSLKAEMGSGSATTSALYAAVNDYDHRFEASSFPPSFREHVYWAEDNMITIGASCDALTGELARNQAGQTAAEIATCDNLGCNATTAPDGQRLRRCGACGVAHYCISHGFCPHQNTPEKVR